MFIIKNYSVIGNVLTVNDISLEFKYPIYKVNVFNDLIIVLLEFKSNNNLKDFANALYAVSNNGQIVWKMEDVKNLLGNLQPDPLVDFDIIDGEIFAFDYCSRKFRVNVKDGSIIDYKTEGW